MTGLVPVAEGELLDIRTGELLDPHDVPGVADYLAHLRDLKRQVSQAIEACSEAIILEAERQGTKTFHVGAGKAVVSGGTELVWDVEKLSELRDAGLPEERYGELVTQEVSYRVDANVAKQIAGANPGYAAVIEAARGVVEKKRYVSLRGAAA